MPKLAASVSWLYQEVDLLARFELAARAGLRAVEIQQPYSEPASAIARELARHALSAELLNLPAALAAVPGQESEFRDALANLPRSGVTHDGKAFTYGFELEGKGAGLTAIARPTDAEVNARWDPMDKAARRA